MKTGPMKIVENIKVAIQKNTAMVSHLLVLGIDSGENSIPSIFI